MKTSVIGGMLFYPVGSAALVRSLILSLWAINNEYLANATRKYGIEASESRRWLSIRSLPLPKDRCLSRAWTTLHFPCVADTLLLTILTQWQRVCILVIHWSACWSQRRVSLYDFSSSMRRYGKYEYFKLSTLDKPVSLAKKLSIK